MATGSADRFLRRLSYFLVVAAFVALVAVAVFRDSGGHDLDSQARNAARFSKNSAPFAPTQDSVPVAMSVMRIEPDASPAGLLVQAAAEGNPAGVRRILMRGVAADALNSTGVRALDLASAACELGVVDLLLDSGADPMASSRGGWTPLVYASFFACPGVVDRLIEVGAAPDGGPDEDPVLVATPLEVLASAWHIAADAPDVGVPLKRDARMTCARLLLDAGADPNQAAGILPLSSLIHQADSGIVELLLDYGADPTLIPEYQSVLRWPGEIGNLVREALAEER